MKITFINVGYGEAILIRHNGFTLLIDGGSALDEEYAAPGRIRAADFLQKEGIGTIDLMILTHIHEDHVCGLVEVARTCRIKAFWSGYVRTAPLPPVGCPAEGPRSLPLFVSAMNHYRTLMELLTAQGTRCTELCGEDACWTLPGGLTLQCLGPDLQTAERFRSALDAAYQTCDPALLAQLDASMNAASLIFRVTADGVSALLPGDANQDVWARLDADPSLLRADVLKLGHHGQADTMRAETIRAVAPQLVVTCTSSDRRYGSASDALYARLTEALNRAPVYLFSDAAGGAPVHSALEIETAPALQWVYRAEVCDHAKGAAK